MTSKFIHSLQLHNFLSYGSEPVEIELQPLNVLIGANASGKSNLIEAIALLKATPTDLSVPIRQGGGVNDFLWQGSQNSITAEIKAILNNQIGNIPLSYRLAFTATKQKLEIVDEAVENCQPQLGENDVYFYYRYQQGNPVLNIKTTLEEQRTKRSLRREDLLDNQSVLSQRKDPDLYPELTYISDRFSKIALYRNWQIGRNSPSRMPQQTDLPEHPLLEDGSNLGLVLNNLDHQLGRRQIIEQLQEFYPIASDLSIKIYGGTVQIFIREEGAAQPIAATRLSDGTLRYLILMALLLDPTPPPLLCIEEPEVGLHPDILPTIGEMLCEAAKRTQLIVTTHSDALVSALEPESVLVCDRNKRGTSLRRLDAKRLQKWLKDYALGDLWRMGEIGGNRW